MLRVAAKEEGLMLIYKIEQLSITHQQHKAQSVRDRPVYFKRLYKILGLGWWWLVALLPFLGVGFGHRFVWHSIIITFN